MNVFDLAAVLTLDKKDYETGLDEAEKEASGFGDKLKKGLGTATKVAGVVAGAAVAAGTGIMKMASSSASAMDVVDKASQRMQISAESYQEIAHAASLSGVEMSALEKAAKSLDGSMTFDQAMNEIYSMQTAEERAAKAAELFGDAVAYNLTPMLNASGEEFAAMKQEAHDLGLVMSGDDVKAGAELNDTLSNLKDSFGAIITRVGNSLMPLVKRVADSLLKFMPKIQQMFDKFVPKLLELAEKVVPFLMDLAEAILPSIFQILDVLMPILINIVNMVLPVVTSALQLINPLLQVLSALLQPILDLLTKILKPVTDLINWIFGDITSGLSDVDDSLGEDGLTGSLTSVSDLLFGDFGEAFTFLGDTIGAAVEIIGGAFKGIIEFLKDPKQALEDFFNWASNGIRNLFNSLSDLKDAIDEEVAAEERAEWMEGHRERLRATGNYYTAEEMASGAAYADAHPYSSPVNKLDVGGTIRVEGVNSEGEFMGSADFTIDQVTKQIIKDSRLGYSYGG